MRCKNGFGGYRIFNIKLTDAIETDTRFAHLHFGVTMTGATFDKGNLNVPIVTCVLM